MKKQLKMAALALLAGVAVVACNNADRFSTTEHGLEYRFTEQNSDEQAVNEGDVIVGEMIIRFDEDTFFSNVGHPDRILQLQPSLYDGDLNEGLAMLHRGDKAVFAIAADTIAKFLNASQMPEGYVAGKGQKIFYDINVLDIVTREELMEERANTLAEMQQRQEAEPGLIADYVKANNISAKPNADGLYVIVKKQGNGNKVAAGRTVRMHYTGRLLDGTMFDSSREQDAVEGGIYDSRRQYEPLTYEVGKMGLIKGWEDGVMGKPAGTILQLIVPSSLGYGAQQMSDRLLPYSTLVFDIEIVSVD